MMKPTDGAKADTRQPGAWRHAPYTTKMIPAKGAMADANFRVRPCFSWTSSDIGPIGAL
jgi:hypothetical protein